MKKTFNLFLFLVMGVTCFAQVAPDLLKKQIKAVRISSSISIDGQLDEPVWQTAPMATDFIENWPNVGADSEYKTEVRLAYDNTGLYIAAKLYDNEPEQIETQLTERDFIGATDYFGVFIDSYQDGNNGFGFKVTAANVQQDAKFSSLSGGGDDPDEGGDTNWDAIWESVATIDANGWIVEMKLPWSALRFPDTEEQLWNINFVRYIQRLNNKSFWSEIDPQKSGFFTQAGEVSQISNIKSPVRLQATPFVAVYGQSHYDANEDPTRSYGRSINGGMDVKYGINDAFTLDMTLIPDFGEAQSDNQELNLSPFEQRFNENRQFFTEGTELFNKGGLFYSRRIGGRAFHYWAAEDDLADGEEIVENPQKTQLYNATKISGRTDGGLGVGFFNATAGEQYAIIRNAEGEERRFKTNSLTNYNVLVLDQNLKNNSSVTLLNTTVLRSGEDEDANVTGALFTLRNKPNSYALGGKVAVSQIYKDGDVDLGHTASIAVEKTSGKLQYSARYYEESDTYDPNDLGILFSNNERSLSANINYNEYAPKWDKINAWGTGLWTGYSQLYAPGVYTDYGINHWAWLQTKGFWNFNFWSYVEPIKNHDYFETRTEGRYYASPVNRNFGININSDRRKKLTYGMSTNYRTWNEKGWHRFNWNVRAGYRFNDKLSVWAQTGRYNSRNNVGYADSFTETIIDEQGNEIEQNQIIFGHRDRLTTENNFELSYTFTANMSISSRLRHYWSTVTYLDFRYLKEDGNLGEEWKTEDNYDRNYNAFTIDVNYRWRFAPGSDLFITYKNAIFGDEDIPASDYFANIEGMRSLPRTHTLSLKVIYFLDYLKFVKK